MNLKLSLLFAAKNGCKEAISFKKLTTGGKTFISVAVTKSKLSKVNRSSRTSCPPLQRPGDRVKGWQLQPGGTHWRLWGGGSQFSELTSLWKLQPPVCRSRLVLCPQTWCLGGWFLWGVRVRTHVGFRTEGVSHRKTQELSSPHQGWPCS